MKTKRFSLLICLFLVPALFVVGYQIAQQTAPYSQGNLMGVETASQLEMPIFRDDLDPSLFSYYLEDARSLGALVDRYQEQVRLDRELRSSDFYAEAIVAFLSAVERQNVGLSSRYLPFDPQSQLMTYEAAALLLYPDARSPFDEAQTRGVIPGLARPQETISRFEFVQMVAGRFFEGNRIQSYLYYQSTGLLSNTERWEDRTQDGFLVVEGVHELFLPLLEALDVSFLRDLQAHYSEQMITLPSDALVLSDESLRVILRAVDRERSFLGLQQRFQDSYADPLNSALVAEILSGLRVNVRTLVGEEYLGECTRSLYRKMQLGGMVAVGPEGATLSCLAGDGIVRVELSPSSVIVNALQLPAVQATPAGDGAHLVFFDFPGLLENLLILGPQGEERLVVSYSPFDHQRYQDGRAGLSLMSDELEPESLMASYDDQGKVRFFIPLRALRSGSIRAVVHPHTRQLVGNTL